MKSSRNSYLDVVKGLGILLVVTGHAIQYGMGSGYDGFWNLPMFKFIWHSCISPWQYNHVIQRS